MKSAVDGSDRSISGILRACLGSFVILATTACETHDPLVLLDGCLGQVSGRMNDKQTLQLRCDVQQEIQLLALPEGGPEADELARLGIPSDGASAVVQGSRDPGPHWCMIIESPIPRPADWPKDRPLQTRYRYDVECVESRIRIRKVAVVRSVKFDLTLAGTESGAVELTDIRPSQ